MVTVYQNSPGISRRDLLRRAGGAGAAAMLVVSGGAVLSVNQAWGLEVTALKPETMATLIQMARDIYPHDHVPDKYYAIAMKSYDAEMAAKETSKKDMIEAAIADLDARAGDGGYLGLGWEDDRVAVLKQIESTDFFKMVRGGLVTGLYNQKEVWPLFGYEGESYSEGGYIDRGFDDIEWL
ncbi:twin-arginine translocation signal domain-containing protein [Oricola cellulosilytica]|uniref:Twin-arginine translocation signal domain-containing protein n=1 Tax=Oricola cellulosilytica TaxID=1429082 RepID=A0A4R0PGQ2_9HYPH|nr:twin-arginine translocation signal domain-containing protein [Oricola cellulosilytica]TCD16073.1 twin-arginine translocation signal domain-containing protein [Oricola cellulosilytica]